MPNSLTQLHTLGLTGQEIRCHGQDALQIVSNCCDIEENACPQLLYHLINHPQYREAFKAVKTLTKQIGEQAELNSELLASRRQINQLLAFHWGLKKSDYKPDLLAGWLAWAIIKCSFKAIIGIILLADLFLKCIFCYLFIN